MPAKKAKGEKRDLVKLARERLKIMTEADVINRRRADEDLKFLNVPGEQWDPITKKERGDRPAYEFNKLRITAKRIINDMRANRPQAKVRAVEDGDKDTADVMDGLARNIWNVSDADTVIDYAAEYQVGGGFGAWRVNTKYSTDSAFDQDIAIEGFKNPFCVYMDPSASDPLGRDADDWIVTERISKKSYEERWPDKEVVSFDDVEFDDAEEWMDDDTVRICEYWYKEPATKTLLLTGDGKTVDAADLKPGEEATLNVVRKRTVNCHKIMMCIMGGGDALLEKPTEWAGSMFPFVPVYGERMVIDGRTQWHGITRFAKDAQRSYNSARTAITEKVAMAPNAKFWATPVQALGHMEKWNEAHKQNIPVLIYNVDQKAPGPPVPMPSDPVPASLIQESQIASDEIKAVTGIFDPSLGQESNETSGRAITARQRQGEIATYNYMDNMSKAIRRTYEILIDLIPKIYDTPRAVRILGQDLAEKYAKINTPIVDPATGEQRVVNDLSRGKYDVIVTVGPSFATKRIESNEMLQQWVQAFPPLMQVAGDLIAKSSDMPYSDKLAERLKTLLPPQIQQMEAEGKPIPPEAQAALTQAQQMMQVTDQKEQLLRQAAQEIEQGKQELEKAKADIEKAQAGLETKKAQFDAHVEKAKAGLQQQMSQFAIKDIQSQANEQKAKVEQDQSTVQQATEQAVGAIQQLAEQFVQAAGQVLQQLEAKATQQAAPKRRTVRAKRVNGELLAQIDELDDAGNVVNSRPAKVSRQNGELVGEM